MRPDDLETDAVDLLQGLAPLDQRRQHEGAQWPILKQERPQRVAVDLDISQRLRHDCCHEHGLSRQEVHLAEEARRTVPDDLVPRRVDDRDLALQDRDERVHAVADAIEHVSDARGSLFAQAAEPRQLRRRECGTGWSSHPAEVTRAPAEDAHDSSSAQC